MDKEVILWLLEGEPWVRYRTLTDILNRDKNDDEVVTAKRAIPVHKMIVKLLDEQNEDGYWGKSKDIHTWWPKKNTTFWMLGMLADFGFTGEDRRIAKACEWVFGSQLESGGFGWDPPTQAYDCHTAVLTEALARLGYLADSRLQRDYSWLISRQRLDGGFWCRDKGQRGDTRENEPSCALATVFVMGALAQNPELRQSEIERRGVDFLLNCWDNRGKIKYAGHDSQIGRGFDKIKYPFTDYRILKYLDVLSQFEFARRDSRLKEIVGLLQSREDGQGRFTPESIHKVWHDFDFGQKGEPSRWITFLINRIEKRMAELE